MSVGGVPALRAQGVAEPATIGISAATSRPVHAVRSSTRVSYHREKKVTRRTQEVALLCPS
jgi:hypothetical protein